MTILWLAFMGLFLVALGYPLAQRFSYYNRHSGMIVHIVEGFAAFLLEVGIFTVVMAIAGYVFFGAIGAGLATLGALSLSFIVVGVLGTFSAAKEV